ncbi:MAG: LytTR family DNA-binding domain-containing protein [Bacteroidales bacterium]
MNKISVAIIEDEIPAARLISSMVKKLRPNWNVTVLPGNVEEAVKWFANNQHPNIIFLDIQLSDGNSFDFITQAKPSSIIIFTTAYDQYAIRAFSVNSIDYILKPVDEQRLLEAIIKYESIASVSSESTSLIFNEYLDTVIEALKQKEKQYRTRFLIAGVDKFWALQVNEIAYLYSENKITFAVTHSGTEHIIDISLDKLSEQLNPDSFFRANRQTILSISSIKHIEPYFNGKVVVFVKPPYKNQITISKEKLSVFKIWLNY